MGHIYITVKHIIRDDSKTALRDENFEENSLLDLVKKKKKHEKEASNSIYIERLQFSTSDLI